MKMRSKYDNMHKKHVNCDFKCINSHVIVSVYFILSLDKVVFSLFNRGTNVGCPIMLIAIKYLRS